MKNYYIIEIQNKNTLEWSDLYRHGSRDWIEAKTLYFRSFGCKVRFRKVVTQNLLSKNATQQSNRARNS